MTRRFAIVFLLAVFSGLGLAFHEKSSGKAADGASDKDDRPADRAAIRNTFQGLLRAIGKADPEAVAAFWTESGEYVDDQGEIIRGRKALTAAYKAFFAKNKGVRVEGKANALRFLGQDSAVAEGVFTRLGAEDTPSTATRVSALLVREKGQWRLAQLREEEHSEPVSLDDVKWLIGDWVVKNGDHEVTTSYAWDDKKAFIRGRFVVREKGKEVQSGQQIIGRDAAENVLRSWVFNSEGGFGSGVWRRDGKQWTVESEGTEPGGATTSAVNILTPVNADVFTWKSQDRFTNAEAQPDTLPVRVTRVKKGK